MKKYGYIVLFFVMLFSFNVKASPANNAFKDDNFYKCVIDMYNKEQEKSVSYDTNLSNKELSLIKKLTCNNKNITDYSGLELLTSVTKINFYGNKIKNFVIPKNNSIEDIYMPYNEMESIDLTYASKLKSLDIGNNSIESIDLTKPINLTKLILSKNKLTSLDVSKNILIEELLLSNNELTSLNTSKMTNLRTLYVSQNNLTSLNLNNNSKLVSLDADANKLTSINLTNKPKLYNVLLQNNNLTEINLEGSDSVGYINITSNESTIKKVKLGNVKNLSEIHFGNNPIEIFTYTGTFDKLTKVTGNAIVLKKIDYSKAPLLTTMEMYNFNEKSNLNINSSTLKELYIYDSSFDNLDLGIFPNLKTLTLSKGNGYTSGSGDIIIGKIDLSQNTSLEVIRINGDVKNIIYGNSNNLKEFVIDYNETIERVSLSSYPNLEYLSLWNNKKIRGVDIRGLNLSKRFSIVGSSKTLEYIYTNRNTRSLNYSDFDTWFGNVDIVVELKTTRNEFNKMFMEIKNESIMNKQGVLIGENDIIKTGDILYKNPYRYKNIIVVKGDVTGSGTSTVSDVAKLYQYLKGKITMDKEYVIAGNVVDTDDVIKINDVAKLYQFIKGKISSIY